VSSTLLWYFCIDTYRLFPRSTFRRFGIPLASVLSYIKLAPTRGNDPRLSWLTVTCLTPCQPDENKNAFGNLTHSRWGFTFILSYIFRFTWHSN
jgi:hypothetical protein